MGLPRTPDEPACASVLPLGDRAFLARFQDEQMAARWASAVRSEKLLGVIEVVVAYRSAAVYFEPCSVNPESLSLRLREVGTNQTTRFDGRTHEIPVLYDGADLDVVARQLELEPAFVVNEHARVVYQVFGVGFQPGFPYAGYLPETLSGLPRRTRPRLRVPAGSVAIAGRQTGIYPRESPGGWHLIGRVPLIIVDEDHGFFPIQAGDRLRFLPIGHQEFRERRGQRL